MVITDRGWAVITFTACLITFILSYLFIPVMGFFS